MRSVRSADWSDVMADFSASSGARPASCSASIRATSSTPYWRDSAAFYSVRLAELHRALCAGCEDAEGIDAWRAYEGLPVPNDTAEHWASMVRWYKADVRALADRFGVGGDLLGGDTVLLGQVLHDALAFGGHRRVEFEGLEVKIYLHLSAQPLQCGLQRLAKLRLEACKLRQHCGSLFSVCWS